VAPYYPAADSSEKLRELLTDAGYQDVQAQVLSWSDQPDVETFVNRQQVLGTSGRRLAAWEPTRRDAFVSHMRPPQARHATPTRIPRPVRGSGRHRRRITLKADKIGAEQSPSVPRPRRATDRRCRPRENNGS
jgi:hypothetical protein